MFVSGWKWQGEIKDGPPSLPLLSYELSVPVKENLDRKKKIRYLQRCCCQKQRNFLFNMKEKGARGCICCTTKFSNIHGHIFFMISNIYHGHLTFARFQQFMCNESLMIICKHIYIHISFISLEYKIRMMYINNEQSLSQRVKPFLKEKTYNQGENCTEMLSHTCCGCCEKCFSQVSSGRQVIIILKSNDRSFCLQE